MGYNMTYNLVEPFKGNALHTHPAVEIFIALDGRWEIAWGEHGDQSTILEKFDLIAVPADGACRHVEPTNRASHHYDSWLTAPPPCSQCAIHTRISRYTRRRTS